MNKLVDLTLITRKSIISLVKVIHGSKGNDIAQFLGYIRPRKAIMDHGPDKYKKTLQDLIADARGSHTAVLLDDNPIVPVSNHNDNITVV